MKKDAIEFLKTLKFPLTKVFGIADMSKNTIDVTCKSRADVCEIIWTKIYQCIARMGPIPMPNLQIKEHL